MYIFKCKSFTINNITNKNLFDPTTYKSAIGSLIYLAKNTRPDISFAVHKAARHCENPLYEDWYKVINILKYLNNTKGYKIFYVLFYFYNIYIIQLSFLISTQVLCYLFYMYILLTIFSFS